MSKPIITKTTEEINICAYCGTPCWFQVVCSKCQIELLVDVDDQKDWSFKSIMVWSHRLNMSIRQSVTLLSAVVEAVDPITDKYTVYAEIIDGSKRTTTINYRWSLSATQATKLAAMLTKYTKVDIDGKYWE